uniref:Ycf55 n=1 Tax=Chondria sp. (in: red algae) TaxID=1982705 RepID=A0A1Z1MQ43_9FLOR|nr:hypothetical protein [Chondria sp. (in: red algae)]
MIKYWPNQPSIKLNNAIVELFVITERKIKTDLSNETNYYLYLDILNIKHKHQLFRVIINEFKILILDLIELNLNEQQLDYLDQKILTIFIEKVFNDFKQQNHQLNNNTRILLDIDKLYLIRELIVYLLFGSSKIKCSIFSFNPLYTPYNHVQILFENFIINTANTIVKNTIEDLQNSTSIYNFFKKTNKCNYLYTSNRSITLFLNNLKWQNFMEYYIYSIKSLYNEREKILLISSQGIITKYIYTSNMEKIKCLNKIQGFFLFWLEIRDLIIPKTEKILIQTSKYLVYFLVNFLSNLVIASLRLIIFYLSK